MMNDAQDAFGHLVHDCLNGMNGAEIVERDDGFIGVAGGSSRYFSLYRDWPLQCREAMRYITGRVLDIGCGAGRHALYLQQQGLSVVGVDVSPLAVEVCRRRGLRAAQVMSIDALGPALGTFDTLLMLGANFGLFGSAEGARHLLQSFHAITGVRARLVAESSDPYALDDPVHVAYQQANREDSRLPGQLRLRIRYKQYATPWFDYLFVAKDEMEAIVDGSGWAVTRFIEDDGSDYVAIIDKIAGGTAAGA